MTSACGPPTCEEPSSNLAVTGELFSSAKSAPVLLTVGTNQDGVELALRAGEISCPCDDRVLRPWGYGRPRTIRFSDGKRSITPRRARCRSCRRTHVLLPTNLLFRRKDSACVTGSGLSLAAGGMGPVEVADTLDRSQSTVRDWKRRILDHATEIREYFTCLAVRLDATVEITPTGNAFADAIAAIGAAGRAAVLRQVTKHPWHFASFATNSRLLCNTKPSWTDP
jgi:hypothetical protein